jgi:hypothetical protein
LITGAADFVDEPDGALQRGCWDYHITDGWESYFFNISFPQHSMGAWHVDSPCPQLQGFSTLSSKPQVLHSMTSPLHMSPQLAI